MRRKKWEVFIPCHFIIFGERSDPPRICESQTSKIPVPDLALADCARVLKIRNGGHKTLNRCEGSLWYLGRTARSSLDNNNRDFKIHYGELLLRQLRPWGTRLTTPFPPQTSNRLRFRCTATGCSASTCLNKHRHAKRARVIFLVIGVFVELFTVMIC